MEEGQFQLTGTVKAETLDSGSKSERQGTVLITLSGQKYTLRNKDEPAFGSSAFESFIGRTITARGVVNGNTFIVSAWNAGGDF